MTGKHPCFVNGIGIISPQKTFDNEQFLTEISSYDHNVLNCVTPDFKNYINPIQLRRLNRMLRVGLSAATICLRDARVNSPEGIITATGYGFLEETEKFLREVFERQEMQLTPTYFMQGTYNALAGLVAMSTKCTGYNNTYVSKGFAFENALRDAMLQVTNDLKASYLVGAFDEAASVQYIINSREHQYKGEHINSLSLFESLTTGSVQGEGAAFFTVSGTPSDTTWCVLNDLHTTYRPEDTETLTNELNDFLNNNETRIGEIDAWISGIAGDAKRDLLITALGDTLLNKTPQIRFKHLCGEYCTAASFALWLGAAVLKHQHIPEIVKGSTLGFPQKMNTILVVNHYMDRNYSFYLLKKA